jgi:transcriptional regulator with XRE-family HTH domain
LKQLCQPTEKEKALGARIKIARTQKPLKVRELAACCGVTERMVQLWEAGEKRPSDGNFLKMADVFGVDVLALKYDREQWSSVLGSVQASSDPHGVKTSTTYEDGPSQALPIVRQIEVDLPARPEPVVVQVKPRARFKQADQQRAAGIKIPQSPSSNPIPAHEFKRRKIEAEALLAAPTPDPYEISPDDDDDMRFHKNMMRGLRKQRGEE